MFKRAKFSLWRGRGVSWSLKFLHGVYQRVELSFFHEYFFALNDFVFGHKHSGLDHSPKFTCRTEGYYTVPVLFMHVLWYRYQRKKSC
jgi:hypothetical protein